MSFIISNQIQCKHCGDKPFSAFRWDFQSCSCGQTNVDGGNDYLRRVGSDWNEMSISIEDEEMLADLITEVDEALKSGRNARGLVYAMMRTIRDSGLKYDHTDRYWYKSERGN